MPQGALAFVLHSHIPYVLAHGQWPHGSDWLTEVAAESYIPLLDALNELVDEGISPQITVGLTPILCEQLADERFKDEFVDWLEQSLGAAAQDARAFRTAGNAEMLHLAQRWRGFFRYTLDRFEHTYDRDIVAAFRRLQDAGHIRIITSAATHGYLPLLLSDTCVAAQIKVGIASYERHFGRRPSGFWMPECAYRPRYRWQVPLAEYRTPEPVLRRGVDEILGDEGIRYTFVDSHLVSGGAPQDISSDGFGAIDRLWHQYTLEFEPKHAERSTYKPYFINASGDESRTPVAIFARDSHSSQAVWSADVGYPGDAWYLDFHKKNEPGGLRYWRVTSRQDPDNKKLYEPERAAERAVVQARQFVDDMRNLLRETPAEQGRPALITAMYDTELFGHWWREGPQWLKTVLRALALDPDFQLTTCDDYLDALPADDPGSRVTLPEGSWGQGGFHEIWLNARTAWMWQRIYEAEEQMTELARTYADNPAAARPLRQAARELLLLESSDWEFVTSTGGAADYAEARVKVHHLNFIEIARLVRVAGDGEATEASPLRALREVEIRDNPFPDVDPAWWKP